MSLQEESFSETEKPTSNLEVFLSIKSRVFLKVRHMMSYSERRLRRMVCQNGGKYERFFKKFLKKIVFGSNCKMFLPKLF